MASRSQYPRKEKSGSTRVFIWLVVFLIVASTGFIVRDYLSPAQPDPAFPNDRLAVESQSPLDPRAPN